MRSLFSTICVLAVLTACQAPKPKADLVLYNATLFTADSASNRNATAVAVADGRIVAVGPDAEILQYAGPKTEKTDLKGAFMMPGLIEGHGHFAKMGEMLEQVNLMYAKSWPEAVSLTEKGAKELPEGAWLQGRGWHQEKWDAEPEPNVDGYPFHQALSDAVPDRPVLLIHASGHALMANAAAMKLAGVTSGTPDPAGGRIVRDASGEPIGVFEENAMALIQKPMEAWENSRSEAQKRADFDRVIQRAAAHCLQNGITSFQDAGSTFEELKWYAEMAEAGVLPIRLWTMILQPGKNEFERLSGYPVVGAGNGFFTCRAVKAYLDGALGSYGAWLLEPYSDKPGANGQVVTPLDTVALLAEECRKRGLQCCVHAIGDRANRELLHLYEKTLRGAGASYGPDCPRWRVEHAQHIHPDDQPRFAQLGVIASVQAVHCTSDAPFVPSRLGEKRAQENAYAWGALLDDGARLANGTDVPVEELDPLANLYAAVTRHSDAAGVFPGRPMTRDEALLSYTIWNAWAAFEEAEKGSITPGKLADLTVFSENLRSCSTENIRKAKILRTYVGGRLLFLSE